MTFIRPAVATLPAVRAVSGTHAVIYNFRGSPLDGESPYGSLIAANGALFGTTGGGPGNSGTVFRLNRSGTETDLPVGVYGLDYPTGLLFVNGAVYGTMYGINGEEGVSGSGVFRVDPSLNAASFNNVLPCLGTGNGGSCPWTYPNLLNGPPILVNGALYSTSYYGGSTASVSQPGGGAVFAMTPAGVVRVIYSFQSPFAGYYPTTGLVNIGNELYGTTSYGGATVQTGTVFEVNTAGQGRTLHLFGIGSDGWAPAGKLLVVNGELYGTTSFGGVYNNGTVYKICRDGTEHVLHSFEKPAGQPVAWFIDGDLTSVNGVLYGTRYSDGLYGAGSVFRLSTTGVYEQLYSFKGGLDGANPQGGLLEVNGTLYGTTAAGGTHGFGTVFALAP